MDGNGIRVIEEAMRTIAEAQRRVHARVVEARKGLLKAQQEYEQSLLEADELGISPTDLARSCGTSEAAIRQFIKRRKAKQDD